MNMSNFVSCNFTDWSCPLVAIFMIVKKSQKKQMLEICSTKNPIHHFTKKGYMEQYSGALRYVDTCKPLQSAFSLTTTGKKKTIICRNALTRQTTLSFLLFCFETLS